MAIPVIGAAIVALKTTIIAAIPFIVWKVVSALGLGYMLYSGFDVLFGNLFDYIFTRYNNLPVNMLQILDLMGVHQAFYMMSATVSTIVIWKSAAASTSLRRKQLTM